MKDFVIRFLKRALFLQPMYTETIVVRNITVLQRLDKGPASLEDLADAAGFRVSQVKRSLQQLVHHGIVEEADGGYRILKGATVSAALELISPWLTYQTESFYEIARDVAGIIYRKSYADVNLKEIMLFGSALRTDKPRDIDMLLLHTGDRLDEFTSSKYAEEGSTGIYDVPAESTGSRRCDPFSIFRNLGYRTTTTERAVRLIGERIKNLELGTKTDAEIKQLMRIYNVSEEDIAAYDDIYGINTIFDVHVLHTGLLGDQEPINRDAKWYRENGQHFDKIILGRAREYTEARNKAIESCRDPTFLHRVLSEGRIYNPAEHDFTFSVEDKYPGALKLFEAKAA